MNKWIVLFGICMLIAIFSFFVFFEKKKNLAASTALKKAQEIATEHNIDFTRSRVSSIRYEYFPDSYLVVIVHSNDEPDKNALEIWFKLETKESETEPMAIFMDISSKRKKEEVLRSLIASDPHNQSRHTHSHHHH